MSNRKRGLGKGLNELLASTLREHEQSAVDEMAPVAVEEQEGNPILCYLPTEKLVGGAFQPRQHIHHEGIEQLAESIRSQGVLQPVVVREKGTQYELIAGERRWRAAQLVGLKKVPAIVRQVSDDAAMAMALIENIQRENLNPIEEALALKRLSEALDLTHLQVAEAVGKSRAGVTNLLRLLTLNPEVQKQLEKGELEMGHARALLGLKGAMQSRVALMVCQRGMSVRETERLVGKLQERGGEPVKKEPFIEPNIRRLQDNLSEKLGAKVMIQHGKGGQGMLVIHYHNADELEGILAHFQ